ncbi:hypothetical protein ACFYPT_38950 [Streptomyces sp. NPDC005529]|uniref:hypothetical protein n=1 Tax=unclassified Streptomyces TaxID=2593676 RepID=UPI00339EBC79
MEASERRTKPKRQSSPSKITVGGRQWTKDLTARSRTWSYYKRSGEAFHITVENRSGRAHASPDEAADALAGKQLHVYENGPVSNHVPSHLQEQVTYWLSGEAEMRQICAEVRTSWVAAMDDMRSEYAGALQKYHEWLMVREQAASAASSATRQEAQRRRELKVLLAAAEESVCGIVPENAGTWLVERGTQQYSVSSLLFALAKVQGELWTEKALIRAKGDFFLGRRIDKPHLLYICATSSLTRIVDPRHRRVMELPEAELSYGLLRTEGKIYRVNPRQVEEVLTASATVDPDPKCCFRVEIDGRLIVVWPDNPKVPLVDNEHWEATIVALPTGEYEGGFITLEDGMQYFRRGAWPAEPSRVTAAHHKVITSDGLVIVDLGDKNFFTPVTGGEKQRRDLWLMGMPKAAVKNLKYGTVELKAGGQTYVVARNRQDEFFVEAQNTVIGTPGCFSFLPTEITLQGKHLEGRKCAADPTAHPDLLYTLQEWQKIVGKLPKAECNKRETRLTIPEGRHEINFKIQGGLPEYNCDQHTADCYALPMSGGETLIVSPNSQENFTDGLIEHDPEIIEWHESLPTGVLDPKNAVGRVTLSGKLHLFRMSFATWNIMDIEGRDMEGPQSDSDVYFMLKADDMLYGPLKLSDPRLVPLGTWNAWVQSMPKAEKMPNTAALLLGSGEETRVFKVDWQTYMEPDVNTANCINVTDGDLICPVPSGSVIEYALDDDEALRARLGADAFAFYADRRYPQGQSSDELSYEEFVPEAGQDRVKMCMVVQDLGGGKVLVVGSGSAVGEHAWDNVLLSRLSDTPADGEWEGFLWKVVSGEEVLYVLPPEDPERERGWYGWIETLQPRGGEPLGEPDGVQVIETPDALYPWTDPDTNERVTLWVPSPSQIEPWDHLGTDGWFLVQHWSNVWVPARISEQ